MLTMRLAKKLLKMQKGRSISTVLENLTNMRENIRAWKRERSRLQVGHYDNCKALSHITEVAGIAVSSERSKSRGK